MDRGLVIRAAMKGDLNRELARGRAAYEGALQQALFQFAQETQLKLRHDVASSGLARGASLTKTWRIRTYRNRGDNPAAIVYSTWPKVVAAFENGATIKATDGKWLAIPNPAVWGKRARRTKGVSLVAQAEKRFGKLRFVPVPGKNGLGLLVANVRKGRGQRGGYRLPSATALRKGDFESQPIFFMVKEARLPRLLKGREVRRRAERDMQSRVGLLFVQFFEQGAARASLSGPATSERFFMNDSGAIQSVDSSTFAGGDLTF